MFSYLRFCVFWNIWSLWVEPFVGLGTHLNIATMHPLPSLGFSPGIQTEAAFELSVGGGAGSGGHTSSLLLSLSSLTSIFPCFGLDLPNVVAKSPVQAEVETLLHPSLLEVPRGIIQE